MSSFMGDFLGFQFGGVHSYDLNITRVSTNDRYIEDLNPAFTDQVTAIPGGDGTYYWDSNYTQRVFNIDFAYDDLRDEDLQRLRKVFGSKEVKSLIFDETPYKKYMVKAMQPPTLRYICFDQGDIKVYKGEGNIRFVAYYPFATSVENANITYNARGTTINNNGDVNSDYKIIYKIKDIQSGVYLYSVYNKNIFGSLRLENIEAAPGDVYVLIDTRTNLIEGLDANLSKTKNLYNKYITAGDFFKAPPGYSTFFTDKKFYSAKYNSIYF